MTVLPLPNDLDTNEWFVIIMLVLLYAVLFLMRKNFPTSMIILLILFSATIARIADHVLADPKVDFYDLMDTGYYDLFDTLSYFLYGPFACIFIYFYERWQIKGIYILIYLVVCSSLAVFFEWITVISHLFTFKDWRNIYSLPVYLFVQTIMLLFYQYIKKMYKAAK